jgi:transcriptional regulator with XRE-family HTH domain
MRRLKQLRQSGNYSQEALAKMLNTTQQTIARWETGKSEPNLSALRDLALIFGVSVDDLLSVNSHSKPMPSTLYHTLGDDETDGFWGHAGLLLDSSPHTKWFPITASTAHALRMALASGADWALFPTLANKLVAFRPKTVRKIYLLDDNCDEIDGDWEIDLPYQGLPLEMYKAFEILNDASYEEEVWRDALALLSKSDDDGSQEGESADWKQFCAKLATEFEGGASEKFIASVTQNFVQMDLHDEGTFYKVMHFTTLHFADGQHEALWVEPKNLAELVFDIETESVPATLELEHFGASAEVYVSASRISALEMPLLDVMNAMNSDENEPSEVRPD